MKPFTIKSVAAWLDVPLEANEQLALCFLCYFVVVQLIKVFTVWLIDILSLTTEQNFKSI